MHAERNDRNSVYSSMKKFRGDFSSTITSILKTQVGTYYGEDVLEGFAADAEHLGKLNEDKSYDQNFYKRCKLDNLYIFDFKEDNITIPPMDMTKLNYILHSKMKSGKACDIYQLTPEHLRNCGPQAKQHILDLINRILNDIY